MFATKSPPMFLPRACPLSGGLWGAALLAPQVERIRQNIRLGLLGFSPQFEFIRGRNGRPVKHVVIIVFV